VAKAIELHLEMIKSLGAELVEVSLPHTKYAVPVYYIIVPSEDSSNLARLDGIRYGTQISGDTLVDTYANSRAAGFPDEVKRRIMIGTYALSAGYYDAYYRKAQKVRTLIIQDFEQAFKILDKKKTEIHFNSKWLKKLGFVEIGRLADAFGLHEFEARENISKRMKAGKRVSLRELLYPLMQGYDSVSVKADVELGGTDQRFNLLAGRTIQKLYGQTPQNILTTELMPGTDGRKMSSSWGNVINITDQPNDMFGKVMSIPDELIEKYFILATRMPLTKVGEVIKTHSNPRDQKLLLAETIVALYHGEKKASSAKIGFINQFSKGELPANIETKKYRAGQVSLSLLVSELLTMSKSEAKRLIQQGGVKFDGQAVKEDGLVEIGKTEKVLQVGKRRFVKISSQ
jgi:tyrosyl-tRNA synthetase